MKIRNLALVLGAAFTVAAGGFAATACSSSSSNGNFGSDSGSTHDSSTGNDSGSMGDDGGGTVGDAGTGADCGKTPTLHPGDGGSIYCPFGPDASAIDCPTATTYCCIGGEISKGNYAVSQCQTIGQACDNPPPDGGMYPGRPVQCEEGADCTGGGICCATGTLPGQDPTCGYFKESPAFTATTCTTGTSCPAGQFQICATDAECGSGKTCQPFKALGLSLGFCQ